MMDYGNLTLDDLKKGYNTDKETGAVICNYCGQAFAQGQVFAVDGNYYLPEPAAVRHIESEHGGNVQQLLSADTKYNTLTGNQKELMALFCAGVPDKEIAGQLGVAASTVRHQKFMFREKAKQAKFYLAVYEHVFGEKPAKGESAVPVHNSAIYYDDRYVIGEKEKIRILETFFESFEPLRLKAFSAKEKNKVVILTKIAEQFESGRKYAEKEINQILKSIFDDYATLRRSLIMYGFMGRTTDGGAYWLT